MDPVSKVCLGCGVDKPLEAFSASKLGRLGRASRCKACAYAPRKAASAARRAAKDALAKVERTCPRCKVTKPVSEYGKDNARKSGLACYCIPCTRELQNKYMREHPALRVAAAARTKEWVKKNPEKHAVNRKKSRSLKYKTDIDARWESQHGRCAVCGRPMRRAGNLHDAAVVDHDHGCCPAERSCGKCVRGLVHRSCNWMLGSAGDDIDVLEGAIRYLKTWKVASVDAFTCKLGIDDDFCETEVKH